MKYLFLLLSFVFTYNYANSSLINNNYGFLQNIEFKLYTKDIPPQKSLSNNQTSEEILMYDIIHAVWENGKWVAYTTNKSLLGPYKVGSPTIIQNSNGKKLFFIANFAGSKGGTDLYMSEYIDGAWTKPKNMGRNINTPYNESNPGMLDENTLTYSSNGIIKKIDINTFAIDNGDDIQFDYTAQTSKPITPNTTAQTQQLDEQKKLAEQKLAEQKQLAEQNKLEAQKILEEKLAAQKQIEEQKLADKKLAEQKLAEQKLIAEQKKIEAQRLAEQKLAEQKLADIKIAEEKLAKEKLALQYKLYGTKLDPTTPPSSTPTSINENNTSKNSTDNLIDAILATAKKLNAQNEAEIQAESAKKNNPSKTILPKVQEPQKAPIETAEVAITKPVEQKKEQTPTSTIQTPKPVLPKIETPKPITTTINNNIENLGKTPTATAKAMFPLAIQIGAYMNPNWNLINQVSNFGGQLTTFQNESNLNVVWLTGFDSKEEMTPILNKIRANINFNHAFILK